MPPITDVLMKLRRSIIVVAIIMRFKDRKFLYFCSRFRVQGSGDQA